MASESGTLPTTLTWPSTASAGVIITPNVMISLRSVTFSMVYSMPIALAAASAFSASFLHLGQPVPRICSFFIVSFLSDTLFHRRAIYDSEPGTDFHEGVFQSPELTREDGCAATDRQFTHADPNGEGQACLLAAGLAVRAGQALEYLQGRRLLTHL